MGAISEIRAFERVAVKLPARLTHNDTPYPGVVTNISENGIFISTRLNVPEGTLLEVDMALNDKVFIARFNVIRRAESHEFTEYNELNGLGCEIINRSSCYEEYIRGLRLTH
ncbi:MAG: PilZ domain-containing protein [Nitrospirae bacterium]|nr:PilZ domain-containing protein [Nitrospirota bacterium]